MIKLPSKVVIDRSRWIRGAFAQGECHCAMGFLIEAAGVGRADDGEHYYPPDVVRDVQHAFLDAGGHLTNVFLANDRRCTGREERLRELFADAGIELVFEGAHSGEHQ